MTKLTIKNDMKTKWTADFTLGIAKTDDRHPCKLRAPSWNCEWYWGMGYLGHRDIHFHLDGLSRQYKTNMFETLKYEFGDTLTITDDGDLWTFCELMQSAYHLKQTAEVLGRGGTHYTKNPCEYIIKNTDETNRINSKVLPAIFDAIDALLKKYK